MPSDASIYSQIQQPQAMNPLAALAQAYQVKGLQSQSEQADRAAQQQNRLLDLVGRPEFTSAAPQAQAQQLQGIGAFDQAGKVITSNAAAAKDTREAEKAQLEGFLKKFEITGQIMNGVSDQPSWERAKAQTAQVFGPEAAAKLPAEYNPQLIAENQAKAMSVKDQVEQRYKALTFGETQRHNQANEGIAMQGQAVQMRGQDLTAGTAANGQAVTRRGQDMTDVRAREANQNGRVPSGYRQNEDGSLAFIPGGPADPAAAKKAAPTEFQGKSATFGSRAQEADRILQELDGQYSPAGINFKQYAGNIPIVGGISGASANSALSDASQKAEQAQRDFVNAVLRQESGAAIGKDEFDNAKKQYFPQPGDGKEVIAQKAANRKLVIQGFLNNAGNAPVATSPSAQSAKPATGGVSPPKIADKAAFDALPSGATFIAPDGTKRRKP